MTIPRWGTLLFLIGGTCVVVGLVVIGYLNHAYWLALIGVALAILSFGITRALHVTWAWR